MKRLIISSYGIFAYLIGSAGLTAFILFMGSWSFLPLHINSNVADSNTIQAVIINVLIIVLFGLHHSIAARSSFKEKLIKYVPAEVERSIYVMISGVFMLAICYYWQPLSGTLWVTDNSIAVLVLKTIHVLGWVVMMAATFEIDHFHLMGLKQSLSKNGSEDAAFKERFLYSIVRHPIQTGLLIGIWSTAHMSMTQLMLSVSLTVYIFIGLHYEEKSLEAHFGETYLDYKKRVPGVIPFWPMKK